MGGKIIVGTQWGDEGKGKITDYFSDKADIVVRFQGGDNAGHTVIVDNKTFKLHLLPSGVVDKKRSLIGAGVVVNPKVLLKEIEIAQKTIGKIDLGVDPRCHIIMPYHILLDTSSEKSKGKEKIGTTSRGIGPCYSDKAARTGIRFEELIDKKRFKANLKKHYPLKRQILEKVFEVETPTEEEIFEEYAPIGEKLKQFVSDVSIEVHEALQKNKKVFFEGAQGSFLDINFGTYPFVTSSNPVAGSATIGTGIGFQKLKSVVGVVKAYTTRVGEGPFLTELKNDLGEKLREKGGEFGTTTGRPRRVGWLDLPMIRTSKRLNGLTEIALTKLDVLSGLDEIKVCVEYKCGKKMLKDSPTSIQSIEGCEPVYKTFKGFEINNIFKKKEELPKEALEYIEFIEKETGLPVKIVSIGPQRNETIEEK